MNNKIILLFLIPLIIHVESKAQDNSIKDSLQQVIQEEPTDSLKADAAIILAEQLIEENIDSATYYIKLATTWMDTSKVNLLSSNYFHILGKINYKDGKSVEALRFAEKAIEKYDGSSDPLLEGNIKAAMSNAYLRLPESDKSLQYALEVTKIGHAIGDSSLLAAALNLRGNVMRNTNQLEESLKLFQEHYNMLIALNQEEASARSLTNIGIVHAMKKEYEEAIPYFKKAIELSKRHQNNYLLAFASGSMGQNYSDLGQMDSSIIYLETALDAFADTNNEFGVMMTSMQIGGVHLKNENYTTSLNILLPAYKKARELSTVKITNDIIKIIGKAYEKLGNHKLSNQYLKMHIELRDSLMDEQVVKAVNNAEAKYENEKKQLEIEQLSLKDQLNEDRISLQRKALGGLVIGLGLLSFLLYRLFGQNKQIKSQNKIITKAISDKEVLIKEIHHRVKNNLQVISSLLGWQSRSIEDQKAKEAFQEGRSRVYSMSLIHQNLYKKDNLTSIEMDPYIDKLGHNLIQTYNVGDTKVTFQKNVQSDLDLDVETVVPLGLMINELLSNSLKYAFINRATGLIAVSLYEKGNQLILMVKDDGVGLDKTSLDGNIESIGHRLISAFVNKLDAQIQISGDSGTTVTLTINKYKKS